MRRLPSALLHMSAVLMCVAVAGAAVADAAPPGVSDAALDGLSARVSQAVAQAAQDGADIDVVVRDRVTGRTVSSGGGSAIETAADLVHYYDMLLDGNGGLPPGQAEIIIDDLARSTALGFDGYPQRFGIPDGLYAEPVAVKQGWMCCIGPNWMHLSTGAIGPQHRYIMVIESQQATEDGAARNTITRAVKTMFPAGRI